MSEEKELKRIADSLNEILKIYQDPAAYIESLTRNINQAVSQVQMPAIAPPAGAMVTAVEVRLSEEERKAICERAMGDIEEQMTDFKGFISQSLSELPEGTLKRIGDLMKKGEKFKLRRRHGCIYLDFGHGDDDFYLRI